MTKKHVEYAFPDEASAGMTLRDWFAGQALAGVGAGEWQRGSENDIAEYVYGIADAMIRERERTK